MNDNRISVMDFSRLAWCAGAVLVMLTIAWFTSKAWHNYGTDFGMSIACTLLFVEVGRMLRTKDESKAAGSYLLSLAVLMSPVTVLAFLGMAKLDKVLSYEQAALALELSLIAAALVAIRIFRIPFLTAPIYLALWGLCITFTEIAVSGTDLEWGAFAERSRFYEWISLLIGLLILASAVLVDRLFGRVKDYSFWGYIFGVAAFSIPMITLDTSSELVWFAYCLVNAGLMLTSMLLARRALLIAGAIGLSYYVGHILLKFADGLSVSLALILLGAVLIYLLNFCRRY